MKSWNRALIAAVVVGLIGCNHAEQRLGEQVVAKVEKFRQVNGRLPESLQEIGIEVKSLSDPPVYYEKKRSDHYIVWYGLSLGESMVYDSQTKQWEEHS